MAKIIPVFIPHAGCPHQCIFCNQKTISGQKDASIDQAEEQINKYLKWLPPSNMNEIAFYGGSFTALPLELQSMLLDLSDKFIENGAAGAVRVSTRPDYIDSEKIALLKQHHVYLVELGIQSLDDRVLKLAERGHSAEMAERAVGFLQSAGLKVGMQLMVGMPCQDWKSLRDTVKRVVALKPDIARIYPLLVIKGTPLETMFRKGEFSPITLEEAVAQTAYVYEQLTQQGIKVIRMGLQADEELCKEGSIVAGPFHPAFGELVKSFQYRRWVSNQLEELATERNSITIIYNEKETSKLKGQNKYNEKFWREEIANGQINLAVDNSIAEAEFKLNHKP